MRIKNAFYSFLAITAVILLSIVTLQATTLASSLFRTDSESNITRNLNTQNLADIKLSALNQTNFPNIPAIITNFMNYLKPVSVPGTSSTSLDSNNTNDNISSGKVALAPEPLTLLLLGTGLMGVAIYRRLKNK